MAEELIPRDDWKEWYNAMCEILPLWEVDTVERVAGFIAQCGHESGGFRVLSENLNYSAKALNTIFPKYFRRAGRDANEYPRQPEKIANVYMQTHGQRRFTAAMVGVSEVAEYFNLLEDTTTQNSEKQ